MTDPNGGASVVAPEPEAAGRADIDRLLNATGWDVQDDKAAHIPAAHGPAFARLAAEHRCLPAGCWPRGCAVQDSIPSRACYCGLHAHRSPAPRRPRAPRPRGQCCRQGREGVPVAAGTVVTAHVLEVGESWWSWTLSGGLFTHQHACSEGGGGEHRSREPCYHRRPELTG